MFLTFFNYLFLKPTPIIVNEYYEINPVEEVVKVVKHIYQINATKTMVCVGEPNATRLSCYKVKEE